MEQKLRYAAIANLRVIAIVAIMLNHAQFGVDSDTKYSLAYLVYGQFFKFGSLLFMIISGFLFEKSISKYSTKQLINRKVTTILLPSFIFMFPWLIINIGILPYVGEKTAVVDSAYVYNQLYKLFFQSVYWFPVNLFIILIVNSFIRGKHNLLKFMLPAILITVFYSVNIYHHWVPRRHNSALFAFFSFFFAGRLLSVYYQDIKVRISVLFASYTVRTVFFLLLLLFFSISVFESYQIQKNIDGTDPNNILRFSNIIYTGLLLLILFLVRNRMKFTRYFKDKTVFLIYLIHPYFLFVGKYLALKLWNPDAIHSAYTIPAEFFYAAVVLILSLTFARMLLLNERFNAMLSGDLVWKRKSRTFGNHGLKV